MKHLISLAVVVLLGTQVAWAVDTRFKLPPDLSPLKARLVPAKETYTLDPTQKGADFRKRLREDAAQGNVIRGGGFQRQIQIQAMPVPLPAPAPAPQPVPVPRNARGVRRVPVPAVPDKPEQPKAPGQKEAGKPEAKGGSEPKKEDKKDAKDGDIQVEGNVQGVIIISDGQGNTTVKELVPNEEKKEGKKPQKEEEKKADKKDVPAKEDKKDAGDKKKDDRAKDPNNQPNAGGFKIQAQGGQIQVQGRIQVQGGIQIGPPQVQIMVLGGPQRPLPPEVDMELELRNTSGREMTLVVGHGRSQLALSLDGPGAATVNGGLPGTYEGRREIKLAPDQVHKIPVKRLQHGAGGQAGSYWTEPGDYTLSATYKLTVKADSDSQKDRQIEVTSPPVKIKVVEAGK
jgi:hypothetical protein